MKIFLFLLLFVTLSFSQENLTDYCTLELFIGVQGLSETQYQGSNYPEMVQFLMERIDKQEILYYPPREAYNFTINNTPLEESPNQTWFGFNISGNNCGPNSYNNQVIQPAGTLMEQYNHGLYKVYANIYVDYGGAMMFIEERGEFFIDFRDLNYTNYTPPVNGSATDLWLMYDGSSTTNFYYSYEAPSLLDQDHDLWEQGLLMIEPIFNHPRIVWAVFPTVNNNISSYRIYKSYNSNHYFLLTTVSNYTFEYTDFSEFLYNGYGKPNNVYYYVTAVLNDGTNTSPTNSVSAKVNQQIDKESTPPAA